MREPPTPRQLPLELDHAPGMSRDDLVLSPANVSAVSLIDGWPDWPSSVVLLAGPPGSGKSHLAAIWKEAAGACQFDPASLEEAVAAASATPILVDDIDGAPLDEPGLFHLINAVRSAGSYLLLTARRFPAAWGARLPDLASRLRAVTVVEIAEPDDLLLAGVITKLFADRQVAVDPQVVQYLVRRIERSLATAIRVVERLDRTALEQKTRITRALAAEIVSALDEGQTELDL